MSDTLVSGSRLRCCVLNAWGIGEELMGRLKLPIQARLIRAGIYAVLVALSYWVRIPTKPTPNSILAQDTDELAYAGRYDLQLFSVCFYCHRGIYRTHAL